MQITRQIVAEQIGTYLHRRMTLEELVNWAETQVMDADFESTVVRDVAARLGVADVRAFGLTWEDCQQLLHRLGFQAHVDIVAA